MTQRTLPTTPVDDAPVVVPPLLDRMFDDWDGDVALLIGRSRGAFVPASWSDQSAES